MVHLTPSSAVAGIEALEEEYMNRTSNSPFVHTVLIINHYSLGRSENTLFTIQLLFTWWKSSYCIDHINYHPSFMSALLPHTLNIVFIEFYVEGHMWKLTFSRVIFTGWS